MSQHFLDRPQIRPIFQQMGRKGVAERMRRNLLFDSGLLLIVLDDFPKALPGHTLAVHIDKKGRLRLVFHQLRAYIPQIVAQRLDCRGIEGNDALFSLPHTAQETAGEAEMLHIQVDEFTHPYPGGIEQLQHGMVPISLGIGTLRLL